MEIEEAERQRTFQAQQEDKRQEQEARRLRQKEQQRQWEAQERAKERENEAQERMREREFELRRLEMLRPQAPLLLLVGIVRPPLRWKMLSVSSLASMTMT